MDNSLKLTFFYSTTILGDLEPYIDTTLKLELALDL